MLHLVEPRETVSFEAFYEAQHGRVVNYLYRKMGNWHDAEDLAEDVFLYCYNHFSDYDPAKSSQTTWLYLIVNSRLKNHYRDSRETVDLENVIGVLPDDGIDLDSAIYLEQLRTMLDKAMTCLSERQRRIVTMSYFENRTSAEIGAALGMSSGNVRVQLSRALDSLEKHMENIL